MLFLSVILTFVFATGGSAQNITGQVFARFKEATNMIQTFKKSDVKLVLSGDRFHTEQNLQKDGHFQFSNLEPGVYLLEINSPTLYYVPVNIEISKRLDGKVRAKVFQGATMHLPLQIYPSAVISYFEQVRELSFLGLIMQNKMIWLFGFLMAMMYFSSKVAANPEIAAELAKTDVPVQKATAILKHFLPQSARSNSSESKRLKSEKKAKQLEEQSNNSEI